MGHRSSFRDVLTAYEQARAAAAAATDAEANTLTMLVYDARESGLSWRDIQALTGKPKSTLARAQRSTRHGAARLTWTEPDEYMAALNRAWRHNPAGRCRC